MNLQKLLLTENECYKCNRKITPSGIFVHSTGANNPYLSRYVGPDDGKLGPNKYKNHFNQFRPDGRQICPHAFIGKLADGTIATYQTLEWTQEGWHSGSGTRGSANRMGYIGFEICEDDLRDHAYCLATYKEAIELCVMLCQLYNINPDAIIGHYEGHQKGIASNHGDPRHWWNLHGLSMMGFRDDVREALACKKTLYRVQVGAFMNYDNAENYLKRLQRAGFSDAFIKEEPIL